MRTLFVATLGVAALSALTGCEVKAEEYKPGDPIKVGLICLHDESSTYDKNFIDAMGEAAKNLGTKLDGDPIIKTGIPEDQKCYNAARDLVKQGCNVIFADSFGHEEFMLKAAKKWPQVQFCHATGTQALIAETSNFHNAFASIFEGRYLAGFAAGLKLREMNVLGQIKDNNKDSNGNIKLGYVGAFEYAEVISGYTSWYLGVKAAVEDDPLIPGVSMQVTFTKSWFDPTSEDAGAKTLISNGAALISQHADSMGAPGACENNKDASGAAAPIPNVTYNVETKQQCPNSYLAYSRINWAPYYEAVVNAMFEGKAIANEKNNNWTGDIDSGSVEYNVNWDNVSSDATRLAAYKVAFDVAEAAVKTGGAAVVFNCANFTVDNKAVTTYKADIQDTGDFSHETEAIKTAGDVSYFDESAGRSAPYFDMNIDGIQKLNSGFPEN